MKEIISAEQKDGGNKACSLHQWGKSETRAASEENVGFFFLQLFRTTDQIEFNKNVQLNCWLLD